MLEELMALQDTEMFLWKAKEQVVTIYLQKESFFLFSIVWNQTHNELTK